MEYQYTNHKCMRSCVFSSLSDHYCLISFTKSRFSPFFPQKLAPGEMTPTATTATRRQLWRPGQAHLSTHTGKKYPVRGITPLTLIIKNLSKCGVFRWFFSFLVKFDLIISFKHIKSPFFYLNFSIMLVFIILLSGKNKQYSFKSNR